MIADQPFSCTWLSNLCLMVGLCLQILIGNAFAAPQEKGSSGFVPLEKITSTDWVAYSHDGSMVAIVHTLGASDSPPIGKVLEIYKTNASFQLGTLTTRIEPKKGYINEVEWVGNTLFYSTIEGSDSYKDWMTWARTALMQGGPMQLFDRVKLKAWSPMPLALGELGNLHLGQPAGLFADETHNRLLVIDALDDIAKLWDSKTHRYSDTFGAQRSVRFYQMPEGTLSSNSTWRLSFFGERRLGGQGSWVPLFVLPDGQYLFALTSNNFPWGPRTAYRGHYLVRIDLATGLIKRVNSEAEGQGLEGIGGAAEFFRPGNPMLVDSGKAIVCRLDTGMASATMIFRFGFYSPEGAKIKDVLIYQKDLLRAGAPDLGFVVTWTLDGKKVLMHAGDDVWLLDWEKSQSLRIAQGLRANQVIGWLDDRHLLVRARKMPSTQTGSDPKITKAPQAQAELTWGLLTIPDLPAPNGAAP